MSNETTSSSLMPDFDVKLQPTSKKESPFGAEGGKNRERKPTEFWLNVGVEVKNPFYDPEVEGSQPTLFINLPLGIALDGMREALAKIPDEGSKNPEYRSKVIGQHQLVKMLEDAMAATPEGKRVVIPKFRAEMYHVKKGETLATVDPTKNVLAGFNLFE